MKRIELKDGTVTIVDARDYYHLIEHKWELDKGYARNEDGEYMHDIIARPSENEDVVHINENKLDNRRNNLRRQERLPQNVYYHKASGKYQAIIRTAGEKKHLGYADTPDEAAELIRKFREGEVDE